MDGRLSLGLALARQAKAPVAHMVRLSNMIGVCLRLSHADDALVLNFAHA